MHLLEQTPALTLSCNLFVFTIDLNQSFLSQTFSTLAVTIGLWFYFTIIIESAGKLQTHESGASMKVCTLKAFR